MPRGGSFCRPTIRPRRSPRSPRSSPATRRGPSSRSAIPSTTSSGGERLPAQFRATLRQLQAGRHWIWIAGNHDPRPAGRSRRRARMTNSLIGDSLLRHEPHARRDGVRDRRPSASGRARCRPRRLGAAALLSQRRHALHPAGLRRLCGRAQSARSRPSRRCSPAASASPM